MRVEINGVLAVFHRPHPANATDKGGEIRSPFFAKFWSKAAESGKSLNQWIENSLSELVK
jgi:hypothetical protein